MEIRKRISRDTVVLYITGKIDIDSAGIIEETGRLIKQGILKILCNFSNVNAVDYNGLSILAIAYKNVVNQNGALKFCNVPAHIKKLFEVARMDRVFEIHQEEEAALKSFEVSSRVDRLPLRRRFKRITGGAPVRYKTSLSSGDKFSRGKMLNLGGEGVFVYSKSTFPPPSELYMEINLGEEKKPLVLAGTVIWVADKELQPHLYPGMGIKFANLDKNTQAKIIDYIDKNLTRRSRI